MLRDLHQKHSFVGVQEAPGSLCNTAHIQPTSPALHPACFGDEKLHLFV